VLPYFLARKAVLGNLGYGRINQINVPTILAIIYGKCFVQIRSRYVPVFESCPIFIFVFLSLIPLGYGADIRQFFALPIDSFIKMLATGLGGK